MAQPLIAQSLIATATTRGGITFDQLCRGDQSYYVCDKECLVHNISNEDTLQKMEDKLVNKIEENFRAIEIGRDAKINKFYIGKTFVQKPKRSKTVIPTDPKSWTKTGISSRWGDHKKEDYGKDGMVVIAVITKDQVPLHQNGDRVIGQEHYTLALEQRLLHYYKITRKDTRLDNETFTSGGTDKKGSAGYALYVAFSLEPEANQDNSCIQNETRESVEIESNQVDTDSLQHTPLVQPQSTVSLAQSTVSLPQSTVSLPQSTVSLPQSTVSLPQSTVSLPQPTVSLPQSTVSSLPQSTVSLAHLSTLPLAQSTLPAFNTVSYWLTTIEDTCNDNNECLEGKQRENNDNESSGILTCQQETQLNITDVTEIHKNLSDLRNEQSHGNPQCPTHHRQLNPVNEDDCISNTPISHLTEQSLMNTRSTHVKGSNVTRISYPVSGNRDGIQQTETIPARLPLRMNRKSKSVYDTCSATCTTADDSVKSLPIPVVSLRTNVSSEPQRGQTEKEKGKEQEGIEVYASRQKKTRREKDKNRVKRKYTCSCCREPGHRKPRCLKRY